MVKDGTFQKMNFGRSGNLEKYGQSSPPEYDLSLLPKSLPMMIYSGSHDELADPTDVQNLINQLNTFVESLYWKEVDKYAHLDFGMFDSFSHFI